MQNESDSSHTTWIRNRFLIRFLFWTAVVALFSGTVIGAIGYFLLQHASLNSINMLPPCGEAFAPEKQAFTVDVLSDNGLHLNTLKPVLQDMRKSNVADFRLFVGDIAAAGTRTEFQRINQMICDELGQDGAKRIYFAPGNHDVTVIKRGEGDNRIVSKTMYQNFYGQLNYYFTYADTLFLSLDNSDYRFRSEQMQWLEHALKQKRASYKRCVIYMHVPPDFPYVEKETPEEIRREFDRILKTYAVDLIVAGHVHELAEKDYCGVKVLTLMAAGQTPRIADKRMGYVRLHFESNGTIRIEPIFLMEHRDRPLLDGLFYREINLEYDIFYVYLGITSGGFLILLLAWGLFARAKAAQISSMDGDDRKS